MSGSCRSSPVGDKRLGGLGDSGGSGCDGAFGVLSSATSEVWSDTFKGIVSSCDDDLFGDPGGDDDISLDVLRSGGDLFDMLVWVIKRISEQQMRVSNGNNLLNGCVIKRGYSNDLSNIVSRSIVIYLVASFVRGSRSRLIIWEPARLSGPSRIA